MNYKGLFRQQYSKPPAGCQPAQPDNAGTLGSGALGWHTLQRSLNNVMVDDIISWGIVIILLSPLWNGAVFAIFDRFGIPGKAMADELLFVVETLLMGLAFVLSFKRESRAVLIAFGVSALVVLAEALLFPVNVPAMKEYARSFLLISLPGFCLAYALNDRSVLLRQLDALVYPSVAAIAIYGLFADTGTYSMWYGYAALVPMLMLGMRLVRNSHPIDYAVFAVLLVMLFLKASRGPVLAILVFLFCFFLVHTFRARNDASSSPGLLHRVRSHAMFNRRFRLIAFTLVALVLGLVLLQPAAQLLQPLLRSVGISARTINVFAEKGLFYLSEREVWFSNLSNAIAASPLLGLGLCGDSVFMVRNVFHFPPDTYLTAWQYMGNYSHNMVLELTAQFGLVAGLSAFFCVLLLGAGAFRAAHFSGDHGSFDLLLAMATVLLSLQFSGTYITSTMFWLLLGLVVKSHAKASNTMRIKNCGRGFYANI